LRKLTLTAQTGGSAVVNRCQICGSKNLESVLFIGFLPPVNEMKPIGQRPAEQPSYPAEVLRCSKCHLVQLGLIVDPHILFPPTYPYTSGTTRILRENFAQLAKEVPSVVDLGHGDLVVDIGSNDGTLLSNFVPLARVQGIEPSDRGKLAQAKKIPTVIDYFHKGSVDRVLKKQGRAKLITATNVFAHIENIHDIVRNILRLMEPDGVFVSESHYLLPLVQTLQYDTVYHEHLRYYSLESLSYLLKSHGLEVIHARPIPTHGGSIRVYAARRGRYRVQPSVKKMLAAENKYGLGLKRLAEFKSRVVRSKLDLLALLRNLRAKGKTISGIGAPSRASTLVNYVGLDDGILENVLETPGSYKIGFNMPGTLIPVLEESLLYRNQPDYALLLSWHIAEELMPKIKAKGFRGDFIIPLPRPRIINNRSVRA
jgi:hypothetical protein